jgi:hypothetical protein
MLSDQEIKCLVKEWHDTRTEDKVKARMVQKVLELEVLEDKLRKYRHSR